MTWFTRIRPLARLALQFAILGLLIAAFFLRTPQVFGPSMEPRIVSGEYVVINTIAYRLGTPQRGDVVAFSHDGDPPETYIKRIIGIAGDHIRIDRGAVVLNGTRVVEPYVAYADSRSFPETTVPPNSVFVLGDNRLNSEDSRVFGSVAVERLMGKALVGLWPLGAIGEL